MRLIHKFNDWRTKKNFTHKFGDMFCTVAAPEDFFEQASLRGFDAFRMACLQGYVQLDNGKWQKSIVMPFETHRHMLEAGVKEIAL